MSTSDTHSAVKGAASNSAQKTKIRRLRGACDKCRIKKIRCDSAAMSEHSCTNCRESDVHCSHDLPRSHQKREMQLAGYIEILERKIKNLEECIDQMRMAQQAGQVAVHMTNEGVTNPLPPPITQDSSFSLPTTNEGTESSEPDDLSHITLANDMRKLALNASIDVRYFGEASIFEFSKRIGVIKGGITGMPTVPSRQVFRGSTYWGIHQWELSIASPSEVSYIYPDDDLLDSLVSLYFERTNILIPLLHRPTFMRSLAIGQHYWDWSFGMTVLMVCALGSKYSSDPRVLMDGNSSRLSAGWMYFSQVPVHQKSTLANANLYDLQYFCLAGQYLYTTSMPHTSWNVLGMGLRYAIDLGAHRYNGPNEPPSAENELRKRAFWALVCLERTISSLHGRPCVYPDETFDVEYPIECDDEYWVTDDPRKAFQQPTGKPCSITAFLYLIKLSEILGVVLRTIYSTKKSKIMSGFIGVEWEARMVVALDSSLREWKDSLPVYLQWDPYRENPIFFHQTVNLHATFHYIHIQIHRRPLYKDLAACSSLEICTDAAKLCARVLEAALARGLCILPNTLLAAYTAGGIFVLDKLKKIKAGYIDGTSGNKNEDFRICLDVLKECENGWNQAGRFRDSLTEWARIEYPVISDQQTPRTDHVEPRNPDPPTTHISLPSTSVSSSELDINSFQWPSSWDFGNLFLAEMGYTQLGKAHGHSTDNSIVNLADYLPSSSDAQFSHLLESHGLHTSLLHDHSGYTAFEELHSGLSLG